MPRQQIILAGFLGMNRSLPPTQLNPSEDGDVRMYQLNNIDPSQLRELVPRNPWLFLERSDTPSNTFPRRFA